MGKTFHFPGNSWKCWAPGRCQQASNGMSWVLIKGHNLPRPDTTNEIRCTHTTNEIMWHTYTLTPLHNGRSFNDHLIYRVQLRYKNKQIPPSATIWLYSADLKGQSSIGLGKESSHQDPDSSTWSRQLRVCRRCRKSLPGPFLSSDFYHRNLLTLLIFASSGSSQIKVKRGWFCKMSVSFFWDSSKFL